MTARGDEELYARFVLGRTSAAEIREWSIQALVRGLDSPSLRVLAGIRDTEMEDASPLFEKAMAELGFARPELGAATEIVIRAVLKAIRARSVPALHGARELWDISLSLPGYRIERLDPFVYAASEWDERPDEHREIERWILEAANKLLDGD